MAPAATASERSAPIDGGRPFLDNATVGGTMMRAASFLIASSLLTSVAAAQAPADPAAVDASAAVAAPAATDPTAGTPTTPLAPTAKAEDALGSDGGGSDRPRGPRLVVLVLPLVAKRVEAAVAAALDDLVLAALAKRLELKVTSLADVNDMIAQEARRDLLGCEEVSCSAEIGGALGADRILAGSVGNLGERSYLTLRWLDAVYNETLAHASVPFTEAEAATAVRRAVSELLDGTAARDDSDRRRKLAPTFWTVELSAGLSLMLAPEPYQTELNGAARLAWGGRPSGMSMLFYAVGGLGTSYFAGERDGATGRLRYHRTQLVPFLELRAALPLAFRDRLRLYAGIGAGLDVELFAARQAGGVRPQGTLVFPELRGVAGVWHRWHRSHSVWLGYLGRLLIRGDGADSVSELVAQGSTAQTVAVHAFEVGWALHF
jgi:hypothetical protein